MKKRNLFDSTLILSMAAALAVMTPAAALSAEDEDYVIKIGVVASLTGGSAIYGEGAGNAI